ncbi:bifunctional adenosylcobinamide kinase/adenosylcobinamide-phosphate guanylyltransferase [Neobacillus citreus]|uniref:Adenosylcobinamide kinase n=1 Tax=Neobacillus citreus TaxID=2833578 RepID=A0A942T6Q6_9BACI|nr:bifunctional adenosylcobinamide kinase/adenosylcobinamide-phosphate guanylyltransferase [Neobacillus citreus]MCH6264448.1 bifunctional adenosylcobinamide kinase/adenosylcobinamide-phosphate guanylyltransferase [Neobacillus citreus]
MILFISGGARSGKSHLAEQTALSFFHKMKEENQRGSLYYIATAKKSDDEMEERIRFHKQDRGKEWQTVEESFHLEPILSQFKNGDVILIDCLTIWLSNVMFELEHRMEMIENSVNRWLCLAREKQFHLIIVSNDVNEGIPSTDEAVQRYMYTLQRLHQTIVQQSDIAAQVQAGIPMYWKGEI